MPTHGSINRRQGISSIKMVLLMAITVFTVGSVLAYRFMGDGSGSSGYSVGKANDQAGQALDQLSLTVPAVSLSGPPLPNIELNEMDVGPALPGDAFKDLSVSPQLDYAASLELSVPTVTVSPPSAN